VPAKWERPCAFAGSVLLFIGTYLHPMGADPNQAIAAFAEYAADRLWVASHLTQLAGLALIVAALLLLGQQLRAGSAAAWAAIAAGAATVSLAMAVVLQAVDGIALKLMVDAWAAAPAAQKEGIFHAAFAVRQIEIGLASMASLSLGLTANPLWGGAAGRPDASEMARRTRRDRGRAHDDRRSRYRLYGIFRAGDGDQYAGERPPAGVDARPWRLACGGAVPARGSPRPGVARRPHEGGEQSGRQDRRRDLRRLNKSLTPSGILNGWFTGAYKFTGQIS